MELPEEPSEGSSHPVFCIAFLLMEAATQNNLKLLSLEHSNLYPVHVISLNSEGYFIS